MATFYCDPEKTRREIYSTADVNHIEWIIIRVLHTDTNQQSLVRVEPPRTRQVGLVLKTQRAKFGSLDHFKY